MTIATSDPIRDNADFLSFEAYEEDFREHFQKQYNQEEVDFQQYAIAYRFGYDMARDFRFGDQRWKEAKPSLKEGWEADNGLTWSEAEAAVRFSWHEVRGAIDDEMSEDDSDYDGPYRAHYQANYGDLDTVFEYFKPAYQYGYSFGSDIRQLESNDWEDVSDKARQGWEAKNDGDSSNWEEFKEAIKHGWERAKEMVGGNDGRNTLYRDHYIEYYAGSPTPYDAYAPAYRYGAALAADEQFSQYNWESVETEARRRWEETSFRGEWNEVRDAARFGWLQLRPVV